MGEQNLHFVEISLRPFDHVAVHPIYGQPASGVTDPDFGNAKCTERACCLPSACAALV